MRRGGQSWEGIEARRSVGWRRNDEEAVTPADFISATPSSHTTSHWEEIRLVHVVTLFSGTSAFIRITFTCNHGYIYLGSG